ncbi:MAG: NUDIX hydrolase [Anaerorhabdus sp.]
MKEKTLNKTLKYKGNIIQVRDDEVETSRGIKARRDVIEHPGGVGIAMKDSDGKYFVVKQYRYAQEKVMIEFPAGKLEFGEDPLEAGKREIAEEVGYTAKNIEYLGIVIPTPSYCQEKIYMYTAEVDQYVGQHFDDDENLNVERWTLDKIIDGIMTGEIDDAKTMAMALMIKERNARD